MSKTLPFEVSCTKALVNRSKQMCKIHVHRYRKSMQYLFPFSSNN